MTNNEIIYNESIAAGLWTKEEADAMLESKGELPIHTFVQWKAAGYSVKKGEHAALTCNLWKYTTKPRKADREKSEAEEVAAEENPHYYKAPAHLFTAEQVRPSGSKKQEAEAADKTAAPAPESAAPAAEARPEQKAAEPVSYYEPFPGKDALQKFDCRCGSAKLSFNRDRLFTVKTEMESKLYRHLRECDTAAEVYRGNAEWLAERLKFMWTERGQAVAGAYGPCNAAAWRRVRRSLRRAVNAYKASGADTDRFFPAELDALLNDDGTLFTKEDDNAAAVAQYWGVWCGA